MNYKWNILNKTNSLQDTLRSILEWKHIPKDQVRAFIDFQMQPHNPYLLTNMDKAIDRIKLAINNNEKICIIGDYDADGITSTSVLYIGLRSIFSNVVWRLPDRFKDGYGINKRLINMAKEEDCKLIITVDNGIAAADEIKYAKSIGLDVIVTDHHQFTAKELPTEIVVNPQIDNNYPFKSICGCMVAFKLILALIPNIQTNNDLYEELVAITTIGTIADVMDLVDENRFYVKQGLKYLTKTKNIGLRTLLKKLNLYGKNLKSDDIGFIVGPCLNACGRLESPDIAVNLVLSDDPVEADKLTDKIIKLNEKRKDLQKEALDSLVVEDDDKFIVVVMEDVGHGLLGIIAGQIADKYQRPCFILGGKNGELTGSGRSVYTYDINSVVQANRDIADGGGHAAACGVAINSNDLKEFKRRCNEHFSKWLETATVEDLTPTLDVVCELNLDLVDERLIKNIDKLKPYGNGNEEPVFAANNLKLESYRVVGKNQNTIQFVFKQNNVTIKAVGFKNVKDKYEELGEPQTLDAVFTISLNEWPEGTFTPQLIIKDIRK